jgi:DNA polymerase III alpha subunit
MARLREQFISGAQTTSRIDGVTAGQIWDLMAAFAGYGFPKAHAAGYATVAYHMAFLKTHYPAEFMAARLAVWGGFYSPRMYMSEARRLGLTVKPPHVNHSAEAFSLERPGTLWMGLGQVREVTRATIESILAHRPFSSLEDFLTRARPLYEEAFNLVRAGALDGLGDVSAMLATLKQMRWQSRHAPQVGYLFSIPPSESPALSPGQRAEWERELLGMPVTVHPLRLVSANLPPDRFTRSDGLRALADQEVTVAGIRLAAHPFTTAQQETMLLVDMEDEGGMYQVLWSGPALRRYRRLLSSREPLLITGRVRADRQDQIVVMGYTATSLGDVDLTPIGQSVEPEAPVEGSLENQN